MAMKENFNKAVFDMFGVGNDPDAENSNKSANSAAQTAAETSSAPAAKAASAPVSSNPDYSKRTTYIAPGSYMEGTLKVNGDVEVAGDFKGDLVASGNVVIHSNIFSNITAAHLNLVACKLTGNIRSSGAVIIDEQSSVEGNIYAAELDCSGKVKGDIQISNNTTFQKKSRIEGNISTGTMTMEMGAAITGMLSMGDNSGKNSGSQRK